MPVLSFHGNTAESWQSGYGSVVSGYPQITQQNDESYSQGLTSLTGRNDPASFYNFSQALVYPTGSFQPYADLSHVSAISINDLRQAFQIQKFYENGARWFPLYGNPACNVQCHIS